MLGDSVVGVKHCIESEGRQGHDATTWALFAIGAAALIAFVFAFYTSRSTTRPTTRAGTTTGPRCSRSRRYAFRPRMLSTGYDWMAFGGLAVALITLTSAPRALRKREADAVRPHRDRARRRVPDRGRAGSFGLPWSRRMATTSCSTSARHGRRDDGRRPVDARSPSSPSRARTTIVADPGQRARSASRAGTTTFLVSSVPQPRRHVAPLFAVDSRSMMCLGGTAAVVRDLMLAAVRRSRSRTRTRTSTSRRSRTPRRARTARRRTIRRRRRPRTQPDDGKDESGGTGTAMALDEGKMGKKDSDRAEGQYKMQKNQEDPQLARQQAIEQARDGRYPRQHGARPGRRVRLADRHRRHLAAASTTPTSTAVCSATRPAR